MDAPYFETEPCRLDTNIPKYLQLSSSDCANLIAIKQITAQS